MSPTMTTALSTDLPGRVFAPGDGGFAEATAGYNTAVEHQPELVVMPTSVDDIVTAVRAAAEVGMPIAVQGTGHSGGPGATGMLINTARLSALDVDPRTGGVRTEAGVQWHQVITAAGPHGFAPLNGSARDVGVTGYLLGGGVSLMSRTFGMAVDRIRQIDLVDAAGEIRTVTHESEPDLFWALRGGKPSIGVVTAIEFDLVPVSRFYGGAVYFPGESAATVLHTFRQWIAQVPDQVNASIALVRLPDRPGVPEPLRGGVAVHLRYVYVGDAEGGERALAPMRAAATPLLDSVADRPYTDIDCVYNDPPGPVCAWDAGLALTELPAAAVDTLLDVAGPDAHCPLFVVELRHLGGAAGRPGPTPDAVGSRDLAFTVYGVGPGVAAMADAVRGAGSALLDRLQPWSGGRGQINFVGHGGLTSSHGPANGTRTATGAADSAPELPPLRFWDSDTHARLRAIKQRHDPTNVFQFTASQDGPATV